MFPTFAVIPMPYHIVYTLVPLYSHIAGYDEPHDEQVDLVILKSGSLSVVCLPVTFEADYWEGLQLESVCVKSSVLLPVVALSMSGAVSLAEVSLPMLPCSRASTVDSSVSTPG